MRTGAVYLTPCFVDGDRPQTSYLVDPGFCLRDEALGDRHNWLAAGAIAIRRISGGRFGLYEPSGLVGDFKLDALEKAFDDAGLYLVKQPRPIPRERAPAKIAGEWADDSGDGGFWNG